MLLHQIVAESAESESGPVIAEVGSENHTKPDKGEARSVTVTMLEAEIGHPANHEGEKVLVGKQCRRHDLGQNIESRAGLRVAHQRQVHELLDRTAPELRPNSLVFPSYVVFCRMRRPANAAPAEEFKAYLHAAVALIQGRVKRQPQARDGGDVDEFHGPA